MKKFSIIAVILFIMCSSANADWYIELTGADGEITAGEYYTMDINFVSDEPNINLWNFYQTVDYDETLLTFAAYVAVDYDDGGVPFPTEVWQGLPLPYDDTSGDYVYNLNGSIPLGGGGTFYPYAMVGPTTYMGTLWFTALGTGTYTDLGKFIDGPVTDQVTLGDDDDPEIPNYLRQFDVLEINKVGSTYQITEISAVPIPGAIFLLGPAFLGLIGLRRKRA